MNALNTASKMISWDKMVFFQAVKRLAELAVDLNRDVLRLHASIAAFGRLSSATEPHEVETTLIACLVEPLGLASARLYLVNEKHKVATSMSGPAAHTSWKPYAIEHTPSLVAWHAFALLASFPSLYLVTACCRTLATLSTN
jgi:hypothetical protein